FNSSLAFQYFKSLLCALRLKLTVSAARVAGGGPERADAARVEDVLYRVERFFRPAAVVNRGDILQLPRRGQAGKNHPDGHRLRPAREVGDHVLFGECSKPLRVDTLDHLPAPQQVPLIVEWDYINRQLRRLVTTLQL